MAGQLATFTTKTLLETAFVLGDQARTLTGTHTVTSGAFFKVDATSGNFTVTLPPAADVPCRVLVFVKTNATNTVTIDGDGAETINGATTQSLMLQYARLVIVSDGSNWFIISN